MLRSSSYPNSSVINAGHTNTASAELGLPLNLGGGISPGDALEGFKRGFANRQQTWLTSEIVCDEETYARLSAGRDAGGFFPAYRA